jgi:hypothetical protein
MNRKGWILILSLLALAALIMLTSSLHDVHFEPGRQVISEATPNVGGLSLFPNEKTPSIPLWKIALIWTGLFVCVVLLIFLLPPELRKRILLQAIRFALLAIAVFFALRNQMIDLQKLHEGQAAQSPGTFSGGASAAGIPAFQPPALTPWMVYLISFGVTLAFLFIAWIAYRFWRRFGDRDSASLETIADIARASIRDLSSGREFSDVIIQSYARMSEAADIRRGVRRTVAMTPREFESRLERAGLPADAVKRLTRLFESVRYGVNKSSQADVNEAVACLNSILLACGVSPS